VFFGVANTIAAGIRANAAVSEGGGTALVGCHHSPLVGRGRRATRALTATTGSSTSPALFGRGRQYPHDENLRRPIDIVSTLAERAAIVRLGVYVPAFRESVLDKGSQCLQLFRNGEC